MSRKSFSLKEKSDLIKDFDKSNFSQKDFAVSRNISVSTLRGILKKRSEFVSVHEGTSRKKIRSAKHEELETILKSWFFQARSSNILVSGPILREKALQVAEGLGISDFTASTGWLDRFKNRHSIVYKQTCGEKCKQRWNNIRDNYKKSLKKVTPHTYRYARQMSFLKRHMKDKELTGSQSFQLSTNKFKLSKDFEECESQFQPEDIDDDSSSISDPAAQSGTVMKRELEGESASSGLMKYLLEKKSAEGSAGQPMVNIEHPVDAFLLSLSSSLKSLPQNLLMSAKSEIFACVEKYEKKRKGNSSEQIGYLDNEAPRKVEDVIMMEESEEQQRNTISTGNCLTLLSSLIAPEPPLKKHKPSDPIENDLLRLTSELLSSIFKQPDEMNDEFQGLAKLWALKLRALVPAQKRLAERAINEILFEADSGTLHRNSVRINYFSDASVTTSHPSDLSAVGSSSLVVSLPPDIGQRSNSHSGFDTSFPRTTPEGSLS